MATHDADRVDRPCFVCGELVASPEDWEFHLHETGLPGQMRRAVQERRSTARRPSPTRPRTEDGEA